MSCNKQNCGWLMYITIIEASYINLRSFTCYSLTKRNNTLLVCWHQMLRSHALCQGQIKVITLCELKTSSATSGSSPLLQSNTGAGAFARSNRLPKSTFAQLTTSKLGVMEEIYLFSWDCFHYCVTDNNNSNVNIPSFTFIS